LVKNIVFTFTKAIFKHNQSIDFIENNGNIDKGEIFIKLKIKDIL